MKTLMNKIKTMILLMALAISSVVPVYAEEESQIANTELYINVYYSEGLEAQEGDAFVINFKKQGDDKEQQITIDGSKLNGKTGKVNFESGKYQITDITYDGYNTEIEEAGYAITSVFSVNSEGAGVITLGVGPTEGGKIVNQYEDVLVKQNYRIVSDFGTDIVKEAEKEEQEAKERPETEKEDASPDEEKTEESKTEDPQVEEPAKKDNPFSKMIPLVVIALGVAVVIFVSHQKGKI